MLRKTVPDPYTAATGKARRRRLRVGYGEDSTVHETKPNADAYETLTLLWVMKFFSEV